MPADGPWECGWHTGCSETAPPASKSWFKVGTSSVFCTLSHPFGLPPSTSASHFFGFQMQPLASGLQLVCREVARHLCSRSRKLSPGNPALAWRTSHLITPQRAGNGLQGFHPSSEPLCHLLQTASKQGILESASSSQRLFRSSSELTILRDRLLSGFLGLV